MHIRFTIISFGVTKLAARSDFKHMQCLPVEISLLQGLFVLQNESDVSCSLKSIIRIHRTISYSCHGLICTEAGLKKCKNN